MVFFLLIRFYDNVVVRSFPFLYRIYLCSLIFQMISQYGAIYFCAICAKHLFSMSIIFSFSWVPIHWNQILITSFCSCRSVAPGLKRFGWTTSIRVFSDRELQTCSYVLGSIEPFPKWTLLSPYGWTGEFKCIYYKLTSAIISEALSYNYVLLTRH